MTRVESDHPSAELIARYAEGALSGADLPVLREHVSICSECTQILLDLGGFASTGDVELNDAWSSYQARAGAAGVLNREADSHEGRNLLHRGMKVAAVLATCIGSFWMGTWLASPRADQLIVSVDEASVIAPPVELEPASISSNTTESAATVDPEEPGGAKAELEKARRELVALRRPVPFVPSIDLLPQGYLRANSPVTDLVLQQDAPFVVIRLFFEEADAAEVYDLRVSDGANRLVTELHGLRAAPRRSYLVFSLPTEVLGPTHYLLTLKSRQGESLASYEFDVNQGPGAVAP